MNEQPQSRFLPASRLQDLIDALLGSEYEVIGPTIQQNAVVYRSIRSTDDLPRGFTDSQGPGHYRLSDQGHKRYFLYNSSPDSWKRYFFPPRIELSKAVLDDEGWHFDTPAEDVPRYALLGVRACDLAAIAVQDRIFMHGEFVDPIYKQRRDSSFLVAINCGTASSTCFCTSMETGPKCQGGFDLAMTELDDGFLIEVGTGKGDEILSQVECEPVSATHREQADQETNRAIEAISKRFNHDGVHNLLLYNLDHQHWKSVANRCLSCSNCTMVCPTCFCSTVEEVSDLGNENVSRVRGWDSCFNIDFSYTASGTVRNDIRSRYRQWLVHKLATWQDQFDVSGCTGCGRCITWCPVGIDLTEEVAAIRDDVGNNRPVSPG